MTTKLFLFSFLLFISCQAKEVTPLFPNGKYLKDPYGTTSHITRDGDLALDYKLRDAELVGMKKIGIKYVRSNLDYSTIRSGNSWYPNLIDNVISSCDNKKIKFYAILNCFTNKKAWDDENGFRDYLHFLTQRYNSKVTYWEVFNEFELTMGEENLPEKYLWSIEIAYPYIKSNPNNKILLTSICKANSTFFSAISKLGVSKFFDIMNYHSYALPEELPAQFKELSSIMKRDNWSKPFWLTECGMSTYRDPKKRQSLDSLEFEQAKRIGRLHIISFAYGVEKVFVYNYRSRGKSDSNSEDHYGIVHANLSPKPSFFAFNTLTKMLPTGSSRPKLCIENGLYIAHWTKPDNKLVYAIWNPMKDSDILVDIKGDAKFFDLFGKLFKPQKRNVLTVGNGIIYIENVSSFKVL